MDADIQSYFWHSQDRFINKLKRRIEQYPLPACGWDDTPRPGRFEYVNKLPLYKAILHEATRVIIRLELNSGSYKSDSILGRALRSWHGVKECGGQQYYFQRDQYLLPELKSYFPFLRGADTAYPPHQHQIIPLGNEKTIQMEWATRSRNAMQSLTFRDDEDGHLADCRFDPFQMLLDKEEKDDEEQRMSIITKAYKAAKQALGENTSFESILEWVKRYMHA